MRLCRELGAKMIANPSVKDVRRSPTIGAWRDEYFRLRTDLAEETATMHRSSIELLIEHAGGENVRLDAYTKHQAMTFRSFLAKMKRGESPRFSDATIAIHVRNLKVFYRSAVDSDLCVVNPFARVSGTPARIRRDWQEIGDDRMAKILEACPNSAWRCLFALARWAGLRRSEAMSLEWASIDWKKRTLTVMARERDGARRETTKQKLSREVPLRPELFAMLEETFQQAGEGSVGPCWDIPANNRYRKMVQIMKASGGRYAKPLHTLRKCCETEWMARFPVMDVVKWMGHSPAVAAEHYTRPTQASVAGVTNGKTAEQTIAELMAEIERLKAGTTEAQNSTG